MADKKWFGSLFQTKDARQEQSEIKVLRQRLDDISGEVEDFQGYDAKFFDAEPSTFSSPGQFEFGGIDQMINDAVLQGIYATETWVYVPVQAIAKTISSLPLKLEKKTKVKQRVMNDVTGKEEEIDTDRWTDASGEKLFDRFQYPNKFCTKTEFFMLLTIDLLTCGQYYIYLDSDEDLSLLSSANFDNDPEGAWGRLRNLLAENTTIKGMYRIPPALMKPVVNEQGYGIEGYVMQSDKGQYVYDAAEIIHVKLPNPLNMHVGLSPLIAAFKPLLLDRFTTEHMIRFYKTGARLGGIIETEKSLNKEQLSRFQRSFENNYTGRHNFHRTLVLPPGMNYKQIEQNPAETALLDFCKYNREAILAVYNVPPIKVGIMDGANYANALVQLKIFFSDTVQPYLAFIEDGFNLKNTLLPDTRTFRIKFDLTEVEALKENNKEMADTAKAMIEGGLSVNEVRKRVWKAAPIKGGEKVKVVEDMDKPSGGFPIFNGASAEAGETKEVGSTQGMFAGMSGPQVTSIMNILGRVSRGRLDKNAAAEMLHSVFGLTREVCDKLLGIESPLPQKDAVSGTPQPDAAAMAADLNPTGLTYSDRVAQLADLFMTRDKLPLAEAIRRAVEQAVAEGLKPDDPQPSGPNGGAPAPKSEASGEKPSLDAFLAEQLSKLDPSEPVTADFIEELTEIYKAQYGEPATEKEQELGTPKVYAFGMSKDQVVQEWKGFITKMDPVIAKRAEEIRKFFKSVKAVVMGQLGANVKAYGLRKTRDKDDSDEILDPKNFEALIKQYIAEVDAALLDAYKSGHLDTLTNFTFDVRNEKALESLRKYAAARVTGILDTTREQLKNVLTEAFDEGVPVTEVSQRINEKFAEIDSGRAETIARTETLTAVSMGRQEKREEFTKEFPDKKLRKMWVSAQDEKVRDSHQELDGEVRDADEEFKSGLKFPRDPDCEDPSEVINCRCTDITYAEEDESAIQATLPEKEDGEKSAEKLDCQDCKKSPCVCNKGGPGSGRHPEGGAKPTGDSSSGKISAETQKIIGRREKGKGEPVTLSHDQMTEVLNHGTYALVSAGRNIKDKDDAAMTDEQVKERYNKLEEDLKASGYAYTRVAGHYGEKEDTFLVQVHEADRKEMQDLGEKYKQDSIIYSADKSNEMIYTSGENKGKKQTGTGWTPQDEADDFYTIVSHPDGRTTKFQLNFDFDSAPKHYCRDDAHTKGGPGSGCHGENCGRRPSGNVMVTDAGVRISEGGATSGPPTLTDATEGYDRPDPKQLAPKTIANGQRNNFGKNESLNGDKDLMQTKGKDITARESNKFHKVAREELEKNVIPRVDNMIDEMKSEGVNVISFKVRAKDADSLATKMNSKWSDKTLNQVTDGIGARVVVGDMRELDKAVAKAGRLSGMTIVEHNDYGSKPHDTGYRATHLVMRTPSGMLMEMQVKTENQDTWSKWSHNDIYKNPELKDDKEVAAYGKAVSDRLYAIDSGKKVGGELPTPPKGLKEKGLDFPWHKVNNSPMKR